MRVIRGPRQVGPGFGGCWSRGGYRAAREVRVRVLPAPWLGVQPTDEPTGWKPVLVVCRACSTAWGCKSPTQPDGGEVLAKRKGVAARRGLKEAWSKTAT